MHQTLAIEGVHTPQQLAYARDLFEYDDGAWSTILTKVKGCEDDVILADGVILYEGDKVGTFGRTIIGKENPNHPNGIIHFACYLTAHKREGFGTRWLTESERRYREHDFDYISLTADCEGRVVWAKRGFYIRDETAHQNIIEHGLEVVACMLENEEIDAGEAERISTILTGVPQAGEIVKITAVNGILVGEIILRSTHNYPLQKDL